ncbi:EAL domain-containing protein [Bacillus sp. JJ1562]|uniref:EAL domain-containing protein n=1 Tax=Bacillus sp. JJ1562 TaxID=3122960 RepID=UPI00300241F5
MVTFKEISTWLDDGFFYTEFQPLWNSKKDTIFAFEAFLRTAPKINPELIFENARGYGLLYELDTKSILNAIKEYPNAYLINHLLFVNVFPSSIVHQEFKEFITKLLITYPDIRGRLVFEINESKHEESIWEEEVFLEGILFLKSKGFRIAFDDLPPSDYPIKNIARLHPEFIKLDRSYLKGLSKSQKNQKTISFLLSYSFPKTTVILEGIETKEDLEIARKLEVSALQGYYFSKPHRL